MDRKNGGKWKQHFFRQSMTWSTRKVLNHTWDGKGKNFLTKMPCWIIKGQNFPRNHRSIPGHADFWDTWKAHHFKSTACAAVKCLRLMVELAEAQGQAQEADPWKICGFFASENDMFLGWNHGEKRHDSNHDGRFPVGKSQITRGCKSPSVSWR